MGEAADRLTTGGARPRDEARAIDAELDDLREELSLLADELDRRREAVDPRVQVRRHPIVVAGGVLGLVGGLALLAVRHRRRPEVPSARTW